MYVIVSLFLDWYDVLVLEYYVGLVVDYKVVFFFWCIDVLVYMLLLVYYWIDMMYYC